MNEHLDNLIESIIASGDLCESCVGNGEDCHGDWVCDTLEKIIPEVFNESMWIPVTCSLPKNEDHVLVTCITKTGQRNVYMAYYGHKGWHGQMRTPVIAWMPLPLPYQGDDDAA